MAIDLAALEAQMRGIKQLEKVLGYDRSFVGNVAGFINDAVIVGRVQMTNAKVNSIKELAESSTSE